MVVVVVAVMAVVDHSSVVHGAVAGAAHRRGSYCAGRHLARRAGRCLLRTAIARYRHIEATFRETKTMHTESPAGSGVALERLGKDSNPFLATIGLRIDSALIDTGINFRLEVNVRSIPLYLYKTAKEIRPGNR